MFKKARISEKEILFKQVISHLCFELNIDCREMDSEKNEQIFRFIEKLRTKSEEDLRMVLKSVVITDDNYMNAFHLANSIKFFLNEDRNVTMTVSSDSDQKFFVTVPYTRSRFRFNPGYPIRDLCGIVNYLLLLEGQKNMVIETSRWVNIPDDATEEQEVEITENSLGFNLLTRLNKNELAELQKERAKPPIFWNPIVWVKPPMNYKPTSEDIETWERTGFKFRVIEPD